MLLGLKPIMLLGLKPIMLLGLKPIMLLGLKPIMHAIQWHVHLESIRFLTPATALFMTVQFNAYAHGKGL
jgi:hypothetical protein